MFMELIEFEQVQAETRTESSRYASLMQKELMNVYGRDE